MNVYLVTQQAEMKMCLYFFLKVLKLLSCTAEWAEAEHVIHPFNVYLKRFWYSSGRIEKYVLVFAVVQHVPQ